VKAVVVAGVPVARSAPTVARIVPAAVGVALIDVFATTVIARIAAEAVGVARIGVAIVVGLDGVDVGVVALVIEAVDFAVAVAILALHHSMSLWLECPMDGFDWRPKSGKW
jgi:hypothetical protein